jgi:hypothetical protein
MTLTLIKGILLLGNNGGQVGNENFANDSLMVLE